MRLERLTLGPLAVNCYVLAAENGEAAVIDPGAEPEVIIDFIRRNHLKVRFLLTTHGHYDHIGAGRKLARVFEASIMIHTEDAVNLTDADRNLSSMQAAPFQIEDAVDTLQDGQHLAIGDFVVETLATPGHTPGSVTFKVGEALFVGDLLFQGSVGRTDFPGGSADELNDSLRKILTFPDFTQVYPGHGPETSVGIERRTNPFLKHL